MKSEQTMADLAAAYGALAAIHRWAAMECGEYSSMRGLHNAEAERAESRAAAWKRLAAPVKWDRPEVRHG